MSSTLGGRVRERREARGLKQADLAELAGVRLLAISEIERDITTDPKSGTLAKIADALETSVDALLGRKSGSAGQTESRIDLDDDIGNDPVWKAFIASERGARTSESERAALAGITRRMGRARSIEVYEGMLSLVRTGFSAEQTEQIESEHQARRGAAVAEGRVLVDRKALQERARARKSKSTR